MATREISYALPSIEPLAIIRPQGVKAKNYYTAYQGNIYGIAVPVDSPVKTFADLKGKSIGVIVDGVGRGDRRAGARAQAMAWTRTATSGSWWRAKAAQTAALVRGNQVDALSQFDTQYALVDNAGVKLRLLDTSDIAKFPSNG